MLLPFNFRRRPDPDASMAPLPNPNPKGPLPEGAVCLLPILTMEQYYEAHDVFVEVNV